jgi:hypothetical protein
MQGFFNALAEVPVEQHEAVELLAVGRALASLGLASEVLPGAAGEYGADLLAQVQRDREQHITRINQSLQASGL